MYHCKARSKQKITAAINRKSITASPRLFPNALLQARGCLVGEPVRLDHVYMVGHVEMVLKLVSERLNLAPTERKHRVALRAFDVIFWRRCMSPFI
jgi:hypothetical protein